MKYRFMEKHRNTFKVKRMSRVFGVSRSGYYAWRTRRPSIRQQDNEELLEHVWDAHRRSRNLYGSPRITAEINEQGIPCGKNRVARIMRANGIRAEVRKRFRKKTTDSRHSYALAANLLIERKQSERVWAADITFIPTFEGWLYVSAVMNVRSRKIIGLSMSDRLSQELTAAALMQAVSRQKPPEGLIHHSDRGRQYACYAYQDLLKRYGMRASMSRSANCYDNAYMESFFGTLKTEWVHERRYRTRQEARLSIFEYVEVFYNRIRRHSALGYRSPEQYEGLLSVT
ncbi:MAG: transposase [Nitrospirae bacterium]|jgi:transposase InsO family protein|nr:transposase [Nitrospirota bacterium]